MKHAFTLAALAFASATIGAALPERPDCGSPYSPPCPKAMSATVDKRQGFIGFEGAHRPPHADEAGERPDCGSPYSPPCPAEMAYPPGHQSPPPQV
ncbi:hypothetical protein HYALB_00007870 [Hymenoscyphus albidus]|uniref:Uncharacterized protein n=1 Tax=Hymenoscyphus albidus TaxID=595503 RepID=A0A9N9Q2R7_9HELO|nr:hypothetical protein HYALB_00007870 [Hymenoscyphus albidus]